MDLFIWHPSPITVPFAIKQSDVYQWLTETTNSYNSKHRWLTQELVDSAIPKKCLSKNNNTIWNLLNNKNNKDYFICKINISHNRSIDKLSYFYLRAQMQM